MHRIQVGIVTMDGTPRQSEKNYTRLEQYVRQAVARRAQLVVAPENILDGYAACTDPDVTRERLLEIAQTIPNGPYLARAGQLCRELSIYLVFGFLEKIGTDLFNSCAMFDPQGRIIAKYSKVHPADESYITPGRELKPFDTPIGRVGFLICGDRNIPANFATLGAQGVEIVILPMDGGGGPGNAELMRRRACENHCWIVVANTWSAAMVSPRGELYLERYESECVSVQRLDYSEIPKGEQRKCFKYRRTDLYGPLAGSAEPHSHYDANGYPTELEEKSRSEHRQELRRGRNEQQADYPPVHDV
ncbi:MAG: carbon-nitrogen hydrolase family protein [Phycisphaerae bacterium]|jgi:predicted amidohydrolase|nr:carbon-nitrogen hydrolase family protein [Phycisphaerae bacterium]MDP7637944.1 carbon-nitrogen hydrolase family protein [Phycisphaerae bacterium]